MPRTCLIANPAAGRGRGARLVGAVHARLAEYGPCDVQLTAHPGHERELARAAAGGGVETIVALGGDGTWSSVARGILDAGADCRLALIAGGTGNDLAFAAGLPAHDLAAMIAIATGAGEQRIDVGRADDVAFLNVASFGFAPYVLRASQRVTWLRGHAVYLVTAARKILSYSGVRAAATVGNDAPDPSSRMLAIVVSNGPRFGGGFMIAPDATISDGALDVVTVRDATPFRRVRLFAAVTKGAHARFPEVRLRRAESAQLEFDDPPLFDADGDLFQAAKRSVSIQVLPARLRLAIGQR